MSLTLSRLRESFPPAPAEGLLTLVVARHEAEIWPSPAVSEYAYQRSQLLHGLADDLAVPVISWGETDGPIPREVVTVIIDVSQIVVPAITTVLAAWITSRPRKLKKRSVDPSVPGVSQASVPGIVIVRPDGARLEITGRTSPDLEGRLKILTKFLS
jgi:hypothetical protein